jgi:hypothetical protein
VAKAGQGVRIPRHFIGQKLERDEAMQSGKYFFYRSRFDALQFSGDGTCRLMSSLTEKLGETATTWGGAVAPVAEWVARAFWSTSTKPVRRLDLPTRLTQRQRQIAKGVPCKAPKNTTPRP